MRQIRELTAALASLVLLAACGPADLEEQQEPPRRGDKTVDEWPWQPGGVAPRSPEPLVDYLVIDASHRSGPGLWALRAAGDPDAPMALFDVPAGFEGHELWIWNDQGPRRFGQLSYWSPSRVLVDPCDPDESSPPLGPTVEDLAAALAAQRHTTTTEPIPVELAGHRGLYLELTPSGKGMCAPAGELQIFEAGSPTEGRVMAWPATDRYWLLDVGGHRVVLTAMTIRRATRETVALFTGLVEATTFVEAESD